MPTPQLVPMVAPDGSVGEIPSDQVVAALKSGGKLGVRVRSPQGDVGIIPRDNIVQAIQNGAHVEQDSARYATKFEQERNPDNQPGILKTGAKSLGNMALGVLGAVGTTPQVAVGDAASRVAMGAMNRELDQRSTPYKAVATLGDVAGIDTGSMEDAADVGNARGVIGSAGAQIAATAAAPYILKGAAKAAPDIASKVADAMPSRPMPQRSVMADIGKMPMKAVMGAEDVFRAAAPTGTKVGFRENVYKAAGDLAEIGQKLDLSESKGGTINPDMRVRATVQAIDEHLQEMYQQERAPQIERTANVPVDVPLGDATRGLQFLKRSAGTLADQALAEKAIKGSLTMAEADKLAQTANQYLKSYESMTPSEKLEAISKTPKIAGLKALDQALSKNMNDALSANGEPGLYAYERRYAALSEIKQQLERRMNAVELNQPGVIKGVLKPAVSALRGGPSGIASASQAAVADVNIGKTLQNGLRRLADSGIKPERPTTSGLASTVQQP